ncbi:hypothetical protein PoB_002575300 [Plakobranchus ocellatus]|uniref:Secreted protein n=1 Tax=Plakobranchus ocellatus TaxID=259542 RepID=A0AAV3ZXX1_9GAST|nr:hypothetical protein PoB_002575300 [Plakobranchus ocellatus]
MTLVVYCYSSVAAPLALAHANPGRPPDSAGRIGPEPSQDQANDLSCSVNVLYAGPVVSQLVPCWRAGHLRVFRSIKQL